MKIDKSFQSITAVSGSDGKRRSEVASTSNIKQENNVHLSSNRYSLWGLGLLTGLIQFVPLLNLLAPIFTALAFIHFGLAHLKILRAKNDNAILNNLNL